MTIDIREESPQPLRCCWPPVFTEDRLFSRDAENLPYFEFIKQWEGLHYDGDDDENRGDDDENSSQDTDEDLQAEETQNDNSCAESRRKCSKVRIFMTTLEGHEPLQCRDQVEQVAGFVEYAMYNELKTTTSGENRKAIALLDERHNDDPTLKRQGSGRSYLEIFMPQLLRPKSSREVAQRYRRPYLGPLTSERLLQELSKKVNQIS